MIRYAAENGYDRISWTPGEQQAARYDLSKQIDSIEYVKTGKNEYAYNAIKDGRNVNGANSLTESQLVDHLGKDIAQKIVNGEGRIGDGDYNYLEGVDLKVGGSGMKGFYDKMIPAWLNKYAKKWGTRVEKTVVNGPKAVPDKFGSVFWQGTNIAT